MTVRYIDSNDKYVQFTYMGTSIANADFINANNWVRQEVDIKHNRIPQKEIIINSDNNEEIIRINEDGVHAKDLSVNNRNIIIQIYKQHNQL